MSCLSDFTPLDLSGHPYPLSRHAGEVVLVVNTASHCGFTPQLEGLEALYRQFRERGFVVLGFPCNQFAGQEPGTPDEIGTFCRLRHGVDFPMMGKVDVHGPQADPMFVWLIHSLPGVLGTPRIKWNFTKFLVGRDGQPLRRYAPWTRPERLAADIAQALESGSGT